jgi:hypothetical protein
MSSSRWAWVSAVFACALTLAALVAFASPSAAASSSGLSWHRLFPSSSPIGTPQATIVYDPLDHELVLLAETFTPNGTFEHTWVYFGGSWHKLDIRSPNVILSEDTWDAHDGYVLLFGGSAIGVPGFGSAQTWTFVHNQWTERFPSPHPPARAESAMAYDAAAGEAVLFGGGGSGTAGALSDTWTYRGGVWTNHSLPVHPSPRFFEAMGYNAGTGHVILFGGESVTGTLLSDTWLFDGSAWVAVHPKTHPSARGETAFAYDPKLGRMLLQGGGIGNGTVTNDTWTYTLGVWTRVMTVGPRAAGSGGMAYDPAVGAPILVEFPPLKGQGVETWEFI